MVLSDNVVSIECILMRQNVGNEVSKYSPFKIKLFSVLQLNVLDKDSSPVQRTEKRDDQGDVTPSGTMYLKEPEVNLRRTGSDRRTSEGSDVSVERSNSSPSRPKPPVPKRPASLKKKTPGSVDAILETAKMSDTISPLRPVSLSLLQDTMAALPADAQEFLFPEPEMNSLNLSAGDLSDVKTSVNSDSGSKEESQLEQSSVTTQNHVGAVDFSKLEIGRDSGPYDNFARIDQEMTRNLDINTEQDKADDQRKGSNSQQSWVSFE